MIAIFTDFLRFSCYEMIQNSDFFEETLINSSCVARFARNNIVKNETFFDVFKHSDNVQAELLNRLWVYLKKILIIM